MSADDTHSDGEAWKDNASALADWVWARVVNRQDVFGSYFQKDGAYRQFTDNGLTLENVREHYRNRRIIGVHSTSPDNRCKWFAIDIDAHEGDGADPDRNLKYALHLARKLRGMGLTAFVLESNGKGGYHVWCLLKTPAPSAAVFQFVQRLVADHAEHGLAKAPEHFPKQAEVTADQPCGNWLRLPGRHHKRDFWPKVKTFDAKAETAWLEGEAAIRGLLKLKPNPTATILEGFVKPETTADDHWTIGGPTPRSGGRKSYDRPAAEVVADALAHLPSGMADSHDAWLFVGMALHSWDSQAGYSFWLQFSRDCPAKFDEADCVKRWASFTEGGGIGIGYIFKSAMNQGWVPPWAKKPRIGKAREATGETPEAEADQDSRPEILVSTNRHLTLEHSIRVLANDPEIFRRGDMLVQVITEAADEVKLQGGTTLKNMAGAARIVPIAESVLACRLPRLARFITHKPTRDGMLEIVPCHPTAWLTSAMIDLKQWPGVRPIEAVVSIPVLLPDGSIHQTPGYEPVTRSLYIPTCRVPEIPANPTRDDARAAAGRLLAPVEQFPFATDDDRAVWLGGVLTGIARPAIAGPVPGIAVNGNRAGTGKGLLVDGSGIIVDGKVTPTSTYPEDHNEAAKVKTSLAIEGATVVHFDNLAEGSTYGGSAIDSAITSMIVNDRVLGTSRRTGELRLRPCWWLTGNNIAPGKDAYRRWLPLNLATPLERPEERDDLAVRDLRAYILAHRGELVRDALTILKAHALAGRPGGQWAPLGSFEEWDTVVRGAVWFATGLDCCRTRREAADDSPDRLKKIALLEGWLELPEGKTGCTAAKAIEHLKESPTACKGLRHAMAELTPPGFKEMNSRQLGDVIRSIQNAVHGGLIIKNAGEFRRAVKWKVEFAPGSEPAETEQNSRCESTSQCESPEPKRKKGSGYSNGAHAHTPAYRNGSQTTHTDSPTHTPDPVAVPDDAEDF